MTRITAGRHLTQALVAHADEHALPLTIAQVEALARAAENSLTIIDVRVTVGEALTAQQLAVLGGIASGETSGQTASRIGLTTHTVKTHKLRMFRRLGARSGGHAVAIAAATGLLRLLPEPPVTESVAVLRALLAPSEGASA